MQCEERLRFSKGFNIERTLDLETQGKGLSLYKNQKFYVGCKKTVWPHIMVLLYSAMYFSIHIISSKSSTKLAMTQFFYHLASSDAYRPVR